MRTPGSVKGLEELGRTRLSNSFYLRDFLYSEIAAIHAIPNIPDDPDLAIAAGTELCTHLLEPLRDTFGGLNIRSGFRAAALNDRDIFALELHIGIKVRLELPMLVVAALPILIATKADQIVHVRPLANGN